MFFSTVKIVFNNNTPCLAQLIKQPFLGILNSLKFDLISIYIFFNEGVILILLDKEKANPSAWLYFIYGSCPKITILILLKLVNLKALNIFFCKG
ncbi:hypothetical protein GFK87_00087 [Candidatus Annandia pinicola]|nr:hypothetical protein GFK87_00087 [Candidatus Annandia pinicola]